MTARLVEHFGAPLPFDPLRRAFPTLANCVCPVLRVCSQSPHGLSKCLCPCHRHRDREGSLDLEAWQDEALTAGELRKRLLSLPGIGPYGAACLMLYLGRPEHVNADSWARMLLGKELGRPVTDKEVAFFEEYGEWRGLIYNFYPWKNET